VELTGIQDALDFRLDRTPMFGATARPRTARTARAETLGSLGENGGDLLDLGLAEFKFVLYSRVEQYPARAAGHRRASELTGSRALPRGRRAAWAVLCQSGRRRSQSQPGRQNANQVLSFHFQLPRTGIFAGFTQGCWNRDVWIS
jgi:hypothetical protein